jgi:hypothetical protein
MASRKPLMMPRARLRPSPTDESKNG